jgi:plastocyanin
MRKISTCLALWFATVASLASAGEIAVTVIDRYGKPVSDVAVYVDQPGAAGRAAPGGQTAIMDQVDARFVPHLLVIQKGTRVEFPNSDVIAHHVYSFSKPNDFILPLYKGNAHSPINFDHPGVVTLGCNIHDHMLAYVLVVDNPAFGKTDSDGRIVLDAPVEGDATVRIWSPRIKDDDDLLVQAADSNLVFQLERSLRPEHDPERAGIAWNEY